MSEEAILQLLQPLTYAILAAGFIGIYHYSREHVPAKYWALSYTFGSVAFLIDFSISTGDSHLTSWATQIAYFAASSLFITGHFVRMGKEIPVRSIAILGVVAIVSLILFRHVMPDTAIRTIAMNLINAFVFFLPVPHLLRHENRRPDTPFIDRVAGIILGFFVATFFARVGLLASGMIDQDLTDASYTASMMAASFRIITTVSAIGSAVILYIMLGIDMTASIQRRSQVDSMTTLLNKHTFEMQAKMLISPGRAVEGRGHSLVLCDIDHFKAINDSHGHAAGDIVIRWVGRILGKTVRKTDLAGRIGGEEFALLLRDCTDTDAASIAEALRGVISEHMMDIGRQKVMVTASFGIAHAGPNESFTELFARADEQLYRAKKSGRDCVCVAPEEAAYAASKSATIMRPPQFRSEIRARVA
ncbi:MAG: GGDEF domain-containing protein [Pseudomonadota bacterium]